MASDQDMIIIDEQRIGEAKLADTACDLTELAAAVCSRVTGVFCDLRKGKVFDG